MSKLRTIYKDKLRTETKSKLTEQEINTDAGVFGPTDILTVALGSCILTWLDYTARSNGFSVAKSECEIEKTMRPDQSMVSHFDVLVTIFGDYNDDQKRLIETLVKTCPVGNSLNDEVKRSYTLRFPG